VEFPFDGKNANRFVDIRTSFLPYFPKRFFQSRQINLTGNDFFNLSFSVNKYYGEPHLHRKVLSPDSLGREELDK